MKGFKIILAGSVLAFFGIATAAEDPPQNHVDWMKKLGSQMGEIRKGNNVQSNAEAMQAVVKEVGTFWSSRNSQIATENNQKNLEAAKAIAEAAGKSDTAGVQAGVKLLGASCKGCHDQHREKISDTVYKIK